MGQRFREVGPSAPQFEQIGKKATSSSAVTSVSAATSPSSNSTPHEGHFVSRGVRNAPQFEQMNSEGSSGFACGGGGPAAAPPPRTPPRFPPQQRTPPRR